MIRGERKFADHEGSSRPQASILFFIFGLCNFGNLLRSRARYGWIWDLAVALHLTVSILMGYGIVRLLIKIKRIGKGRSAQR